MWFLGITFLVYFSSSLFYFLHFFCINVFSFSVLACNLFVKLFFVTFTLRIIIYRNPSLIQLNWEGEVVRNT
jgi:hypothetical protein